MLYFIVSFLLIIAQTDAVYSTTEHRIRLLQETIALSQHRIDAENVQIADAVDELRAALRDDDAAVHKGRQLGAGWQQYMNQGIATGAQYANAGASGDEDFSQLSQDTSDSFAALNHKDDQHEPLQASEPHPASNALASLTNAFLPNLAAAAAHPLNGASPRSASNDLHASIVNAVEGSIAGPIEALTGVVVGRVPPPATSAQSGSPPTQQAHAPGGTASESGSLPQGHATWRDYMMAGIEAGRAYAELGAGTADGTSDPSMDFGSLSQTTADTFHQLNVQGDEPRQDAPAARASPQVAPPHEESGMPDKALAPGEKVAPWQDYMNTGISTGINFAEAGADTANGDNDPSTAFGGLSQQTADEFVSLTQAGGASGGASAEAQQPEAAAGSASPSDAKAVNTPPASHATWQDYMREGIKTGLAFAKAGAGTASGDVDPSTAFGLLAQLTADHFATLLHQGIASAPADAQPNPPGSRRRLLFADSQDRF